MKSFLYLIFSFLFLTNSYCLAQNDSIFRLPKEQYLDIEFQIINMLVETNEMKIINNLCCKNDTFYFVANEIYTLPHIDNHKRLVDSNSHIRILNNDTLSKCFWTIDGDFIYRHLENQTKYRLILTVKNKEIEILLGAVIKKEEYNFKLDSFCIYGLDSLINQTKTKYSPLD